MTTRQQLLDSAPCFTPRETAVIIGELYRKGARAGEPNVRAVREMIRAGRLALVDPSAAPGRWQVTRPSIVAYLSPAPPAPMRVLSGAPRPWSDAGGGADTPAGAA